MINLLTGNETIMRRWAILACGALALVGVLHVCGHAAEGAPARVVPPLVYRVETDGFGASEADIRAVLDSAGRELFQFFPDYKIEPLVVTRGRSGPITLYQRNDRGEIVICLDTGQTYWCQYAYQFAHEFCHVLCGLAPGDQRNKWFEETLCETASLHVMRAMSRTWKTSAPYANWTGYRDSLRDYVDDVVRKRDRVDEIYGRGLHEFYRVHQATLEKEPASRELNGAMSLVFLQLFEQHPEHWEAVRWLNSRPSPKDEPFEKYLQRWHGAVPQKHQPFVERLAHLFGLPLQPAEGSPNPASKPAAAD
jgi:hypothetical protein